MSGFRVSSLHQGGPCGAARSHCAYPVRQGLHGPIPLSLGQAGGARPSATHPRPATEVGPTPTGRKLTCANRDGTSPQCRTQPQRHPDARQTDRRLRQAHTFRPVRPSPRESPAAGPSLASASPDGPCRTQAAPHQGWPRSDARGHHVRPGSGEFMYIANSATCALDQTARQLLFGAPRDDIRRNDRAHRDHASNAGNDHARPFAYVATSPDRATRANRLDRPYRAALVRRCRLWPSSAVRRLSSA